MKRFNVTPEKGSKVRAHPSSQKLSGQEYLSVSLRHLKSSHCLTHCTQEEVLSFADKVRVLTQKSWLELGQSHRHGIGYEKIDRNSLTVAVPNHVTPEVNIIAFRFAGMKPMVGYKDKETFFVLWFDREFRVYDHG
jgi:hypothetical protein